MAIVVDAIHPIPASSRTLHASAAKWHEFDRAVLEYYANVQSFTIETRDESGRIRNRMQHTVDFVVLKDEPYLEDWREESQLLTLERKDKERYVKVGRFYRSEEGCWHDREMETLCARIGLHHRLRTSSDIPRQFIENMRFLDGYLDERTPLLASDTQETLRALLHDGPVLYRTLLENQGFSADVILSAVAQDIIYVDLFSANMRDIDNLNLFRDREMADAYGILSIASERAVEEPLLLPGMGALRVGSQLSHNGRVWEVMFAKTGKDAAYLLSSPDGHRLSLPMADAEQLFAKQSSPEERRDLFERQKRREVGDMSATQLARASKKLKAVLSGSQVDSPSTTARANRVLRNAPSLFDAFVALGGRDDAKGSRAPRLSPETEALAKQVVETRYNGPDAWGAAKTYRQFTHDCDEQKTGRMSFPTFLLRIDRYGSSRKRGGRRKEYRESDIPLYLDFREPVHGLFPHELLYIDHTLLNIFTVGPKGQDWKKPWLSVGRDGNVPRARSMYLDYRAPSQSSALMILRDYVRRWGCLPRIIVVDGGAEFKKGAFRFFCDTFGTDVRYRSTEKPRGGAPIESLFGVTEVEFINGLEGNSLQLKQPRLITGSHNPNDRRRWLFESLYRALDRYLFDVRPADVHPTLGITPLEYEQMQLQDMGERKHLAINFDENLLLMTSSFPSQHFHKIYPGRGIWDNGGYYWHSDMSALGGKKLEIRLEDWAAAVVYVNTGEKWVTAIKRVIEPYGKRQRYEVEQAKRQDASFNRLAAQQGRDTVSHARRLVECSDPLVFDALIAEQRKVIGDLYGSLSMTMARPLPEEVCSVSEIPRPGLPSPFQPLERRPPESSMMNPEIDKSSDAIWSEPDQRTGFL